MIWFYFIGFMNPSIDKKKDQFKSDQLINFSISAPATASLQKKKATMIKLLLIN